MSDTRMTTASAGIAGLPDALRTMSAMGHARVHLPDAAHCIALASVIERGLATKQHVPGTFIPLRTPPRERRDLVWGLAMWLSGFLAGSIIVGAVCLIPA